MRIYIVAPFLQSDRAQRMASALRHRGHTIVSTWHEGPHAGICDPSDEKSRRQLADKNTGEMRAADAFVALMDCPARAKESHRELGFARALGKPIVELVSLIRTEGALSDSLSTITQDWTELPGLVDAIEVDP